MGWSIFDVLDFIPLVGTVARLGQALDDHIKGDDAAAREHASMGGMNLGLDLLSVATMGMGRIVGSGARAASKVGVEVAAHAAGEVVVHGAVEATSHGITSSNLRNAFTAARQASKRLTAAIRPRTKLQRVVLGAAGVSVAGGSLAGVLLDPPIRDEPTAHPTEPATEPVPKEQLSDAEDMFDVFIVPTAASLVVFVIPIQDRTFWAGVTFTSAMALQHILIRGEEDNGPI